MSDSSSLLESLLESLDDLSRLLFFSFLCFFFFSFFSFLSFFFFFFLSFLSFLSFLCFLLALWLASASSCSAALTSSILLFFSCMSWYSLSLAAMASPFLFSLFSAPFSISNIGIPRSSVPILRLFPCRRWSAQSFSITSPSSFFSLA